jgi:uncharacterized protein (DUF2235 family)
MKRLVVCADGTWNSADSANADGKGFTNVARMRDAIAPRGPDNVEQRVKYYHGIGAQGSLISRWIAGAFGVGLSKNVKHLYLWLVENYTPGDELFLFGFSRGAFTVRSLSGLIRKCGILRLRHADKIDAAYDLYSTRDKSRHPDAPVSVKFRADYSHSDVTPIKCIAVWDTVGSLGVPTKGPIGMYTRRKYGFHDVRLSRFVEHAFHAVAIDEHRDPFKPTLWGVRESGLVERNGKQVVEQIWFPGVHSDIGGGYAGTGLSDLAFRWIATRASDCGLELKPGVLSRYAGDCLGELHDSMTWFYRLMGIHIRPIRKELRDEETGEVLHTFEYVAGDAFKRRELHIPPRYTPRYAPENLRQFGRAIDVAAPVG